MAELTYYCGTMDSGKSTLALQTAHNHQSRGRTGLIFTNQDRAGVGVNRKPKSEPQSLARLRARKM